MIAFLNGRFVEAESATVSIFDRGFLYGDGLFETVRFHRGKPFLWAAHLHRLQRGLETLKIPNPVALDSLRGLALELVARNSIPNALLRLAITRGRGPRGYSPRDARQPTLVMTLHEAPALESTPVEPCVLHTASVRVPCGDALTATKSSSRLLNVMARAEADAAGADEALLLNVAGNVAEASAANVFWFAGDRLLTPPLADGALDGVTRGFVLGLARRLGWPAEERSVDPAGFRAADGVFLTMSSRGIVEVISLDGAALGRHARVEALRTAYEEEVICHLSD